MSHRTINYYEFSAGEPDWQRLKQAFERNVSKYNIPFFEANSEIEQEFLLFCKRHALTPHRKTIFEYTTKSTTKDAFLFLALKSEEGICIPETESNLFDMSQACPGGGAFGSCGRGGRQINQIYLESKGIERVKIMGLLACRHPHVPRVFLISAKVAESLRIAQATGCEILPSNSADCYQLRIHTETSGPTRIGNARMGKRCPVCGTAKLFFGDSERYFIEGDLKPTDFQICRYYSAENVGRFEILNGFPIVSERIFNLLLSLKIKGLDKYSTDPPIQHAVVQVRSA